MPVKTKTGQWGSSQFVESIPKKTRQGTGKHTKYAASSRNEAKKKVPRTRKINTRDSKESFFCCKR